MRIAVFRKSL